MTVNAQIANPPPERFNFAQYLLAKNCNHPQRIAYIDDNCSLTYGLLDERIRRMAAALLALGLQPSERILLVMHDTVDLPVAFLGALFAGIVPVPVNTLLPASDYAYLIEHSQAQCIVVSAACLPVVSEALQTIDAKPKLIASGAPDENERLHHFSALLDTPPLRAAANTASTDAASWLYSSGSTGRPKNIIHAHANLYWTNALYAVPVLGLCADDVIFSAAKLFFAYGLGNALTFPLSVGATVILMAERATPQSVTQRVMQHRPTVFFGIPTLYVAWLASAVLPSRRDVALRLCISAGEPLSRSTGERCQQHFGCAILDGLGSTELLHIYVSNRTDATRYGTSGTVVPGYEVELRGDDDQPVAVGETGELYVRGPSAALTIGATLLGTRDNRDDGWIRTGDNFRVDAHGYFTSVGRCDDMLRVSGQYVSPIEVESVLAQHPAILECAVVGKTDADGLTRTVAYVVLRRSESAHTQLSQNSELAIALKHFVKSRLAPHKYPREFVFVEALPKTATGKIQRFKLRAG